MPQRKRKLPISSTGQPVPELKADAAFWKRCEIVFGQTVSGEIRDQIVAATNNFLWFASMETEAEDVNAVADRIGRYRKAIGVLLNEQAKPGSTATIFYTDYLVQSEFPSATLDQLHDLLMSYLGACTRAQSRAVSKDEPEFRPGGSWDAWIRQVRAILKLHGLLTTVRHDVLYEDHDRPSRFPLLVCELQQGFPAQYRRGTHSLKALESAIGRAVAGSQTTTEDD